MTWTAPMTAVANTAFTASQFNTYVRDNLLECGPAKATTPGSLITVNAANELVERTPGFAHDDPLGESYSLTSFGPLSNGLSVTATSGGRALMLLSCKQWNSSPGNACYTAVRISGANTEVPLDENALTTVSSNANETTLATYATIWDDSFVAGTCTFSVEHKVDGGTGYFRNRRITIMPF